MLGDLDPAQIERVLLGQLVGRIGCHAEGRTYVVPITYAYVDGCAYAHSAEGRKLRMMRANPDVCFEVEEILDLACWKTVIAHGVFEELHGGDAERAAAILLQRFRRQVVSDTATPHGSNSPAGPAVFYRIRLGDRTGRYELA